MTNNASTSSAPSTPNKVVQSVASGQSTHLPDKGILCEIFKTTGSCPVTNCPYSHIQANARRRLPTMVCHYYINARCLRENCHYFHGPRRLYEQLKANGVAEFTPADFMPTRNPLSELPSSEVGMPASKIALALFGLSVESEQARPRAVPPPPFKFPAPAREASLPPPPPYPGTAAFQPIAASTSMMWAPPMMVPQPVLAAPPFMVPAGQWPAHVIPHQHHAMMFGPGPMLVSAAPPPLLDISIQPQPTGTTSAVQPPTSFQ